ncbi:hypothetical protein MNV49_007857 [Pseudohyphozyma bogoriensis]|nr:hypothetical protein MNV49_007857 [Pseudohyphozyma bogoriensis]
MWVPVITFAQVGHPTILINNAGIVKGKLLVELTPEDVQKTFSVNVLSQFSLIRAFLPEMIKNRRGHIVTVSSVFGFAAAAQLSDYSASKHALVGLHESLRCELRYRHGDPPIRTTLLVPGRIHTPLFESLAAPSPLVSFLAPTVEPHTIAKKVIAALECETSTEIYIPRYGGLLWAVRGLPSWCKEGLERLAIGR